MVDSLAYSAALTSFCARDSALEGAAAVTRAVLRTRSVEHRDAELKSGMHGLGALLAGHHVRPQPQERDFNSMAQRDCDAGSHGTRPLLKTSLAFLKVAGASGAH
jgi:hypothetical protein